MKKMIMAAMAAFIAVSAFAQEFPYSKVFYASPAQLEEQGFSYSKNSNTYTINHDTGAGWIASLAYGAVMHAQNDYHIDVMMGEDQQKAIVTVRFYDQSIYETILKFAAENGEDVLDVTTGSGERKTYTALGYFFTIERKKVEVKDTDTVTGTNQKGNVSTSKSTTTDVSYDEFIYTINTGIQPSSPKLDKQAAKEAKRQDKGKKSSSSEAFL